MAESAPTRAEGCASSSETEVVGPLPPLPDSERGTSYAHGKAYKAEVTNKEGYMCHIQLETTFDVAPDIVFRIFTHQDNAGAFRDIKHVGNRRVLEEQPRWKKVEVEQLGELRILWIRRTFSTVLEVEEDARDPQRLVTQFHLLRSDVLARFQGRWELLPVTDPGTGAVVGTLGILSQDVLPKGMPPFLAHMPVLGGLLRRVSLATIERLVQDMLHICNRYKAAGDTKSVEQVMQEVAAERGHRPTRVTGVAASAAATAGVQSFEVSDEGTEVEEEEQEEDEGARLRGAGPGGQLDADLAQVTAVLQAQGLGPGSPQAGTKQEVAAP